MKNDLEIAHSIQLRPIEEVAAQLGIAPDELEHYGRDKAKVPLHYIDPKKIAASKLILVSAISPTPAGEGKTTVSIGLSQALNRIGKRSAVALREPSLGPIFGIKGGATGGGYSQVVPMEEINLNFTGDFPSIEKAHNLLAALIDNNLQSRRRSLGIDPRTVAWKRVMDMNDRSLRDIVAGLGGTSSGIPRETGFDITAASEVMAILCLASGIEDLKQRLGNIFVGYTYDKRPVYARDLKAQGAMAALLKDALKPNLVQTLEGTPAFVHGGPFANIAQGTNTVLATKMALSLTDYVVTEAGFGFDLGGEKFLDIKCRYAGLCPSAVVIVATIRALKYHGGQPLTELTAPSVEALERGVVNLQKHLENVAQFGLKPVVAINRFVSDTPQELAFVQQFCQEAGIECSIADVWSAGGAGAEELARKVAEVADRSDCASFHQLYPLDAPVEQKILLLAQRIYGAASVEYSPKARTNLKQIKALGLEGLAICMAKTQKSLSDNPELLGRPEGFILTIREIEIAAGAGFLVPITGDMMRMPGLPEEPSSEHIDIDAEGNITGLF